MVKKKSEKTTKKQVENKPKDKTQDQKEADTKVKELEQLIFSIKFYPVAVSKEAKETSVKKIIEEYNLGNDNVKQLLLYMIHEHISQVADLKIMHNFDFFRKKFPNLEPLQTRLNVYRSMFNYNFSIEGLCELVSLLGRLSGDDAAKLLTYHFTYLAFVETDSTNILKNAVIDSLGDSNSIYAFESLISYAKYSDNERLLQRVGASLSKWSDKVDSLNLSEEKKNEIITNLASVTLPNFKENHYR